MESTNLTRKQQKIFAGNTTITDEQIAVFGSKTQTGTMTFSKDPDVIQNENWQKGWQNATVIDEAPFEEDFNAISFVNSYNTAYLLQKGIPEYSENTTYFKGSICMIIDNNGEPTIYYSKTDNNTGNNPATDSTNWANLYNYISSLISNNFVILDGSNAEFNNLSSNAKNNILSIVMPDYSSAIALSQTSGSIYTPIVDGIILANLSGTDNNLVIKLNDSSGIVLAKIDAYNNSGSSIFLPVIKDEKYYFESAFYNNLYFIPYKNN